jgi:hypothetical protein
MVPPNGTTRGNLGAIWRQVTTCQPKGGTNAFCWGLRLAVAPLVPIAVEAPRGPTGASKTETSSPPPKELFTI